VDKDGALAGLTSQLATANAERGQLASAVESLKQQLGERSTEVGAPPPAAAAGGVLS
jgi:hypothetical protein